MLSETGFYIVYGIGIVWFAAAAIYSYQAAIRDLIDLARQRKSEKRQMRNG